MSWLAEHPSEKRLNNYISIAILVDPKSMSENNESIPEKKKEKIRVFQYNDKLQEFEELEVEEDVPLYELLDPDFVLLFVDPRHFRVWIWHGANTTTRMKFIAAKLAPNIRDQFGIGYKITAVDEGNETMGFKIAVGLEEEVDYEEVEKGPKYEGSEEDLALLEELGREKILLVLKKAGIPKGYERKMVIVKNQIYGYKEYEVDYMDSVVKEPYLFPLQEDIEDGTYLAKNYVPRMLFSFNKVILTELLQKVDGKENDIKVDSETGIIKDDELIESEEDEETTKEEEKNKIIKK
ncbi:MAG: hypothetical protein BAJALOKI2v1_670021 [Promethearchaeota archaeon]|nr:MAG: hypothetical protein BAJALOKI2v1_670021 [Candidatus Lokiarchaeota archaeon]